MGKYNVGDKVVIRKDLVVGENYGWWYRRLEYLKELDYVVIDYVTEDGDYLVEKVWYITDEMISHKYKKLKLYEVTYFDKAFEEHNVLKVAEDKESAIKSVGENVTKVFATEINEVDGYEIRVV